MTDRDEGQDDGAVEPAPPTGRDAVTDTSDSSASARVREVIGRRGYDEGEDETANEDEQH